MYCTRSAANCGLCEHEKVVLAEARSLENTLPSLAYSELTRNDGDRDLDVATMKITNVNRRNIVTTRNLRSCKTFPVLFLFVTQRILF